MPAERRTSFVCYPVTAAGAYPIDRGWLRILNPAVNTPVQFTSFGQKSVTAQIVCHRGYALTVGDILKDTFDNRVYLVQQTAIQSPNQLLWVQEIRRPIPDAFETETLKSFWTNELFLLSNPQYYGTFYYATPSASNISGAGICYQVTRGDFDIWGAVTLTESDENDTGTCYVLLMARDPDTGYGVGVGLREIIGTGQSFVRVDYTASGLYVTAPSIPVATGAGAAYRLLRSGSRFRCFVNRSLPAGVALDDYDYPNDFWIEMSYSGTPFISTDDLQVGVGGWHTSDMSFAYGSMDAMRNWLPS